MTIDPILSKRLISDIARMFNAGLTIKCVVYGVTACALAYRGLMVAFK